MIRVCINDKEKIEQMKKQMIETTLGRLTHSYDKQTNFNVQKRTNQFMGWGQGCGKDQTWGFSIIVFVLLWTLKPVCLL